VDLGSFSNHELVPGARPIETMRETTVKQHKLLQTATHELHCFILISIYSFITRIQIVLHKL